MNYARYATIHARHLPTKICLIERTPSTNARRTLTWRQFNEEVNKVANYLSIELGVRKGDYVMHLQHNSLEWLITYYGIIKLGAVVVPLNFRFVGSDIQYAAEVCRPKVFILGAEFLPVVQPLRQRPTMVQAYICLGTPVPGDMIDYAKLAAYPQAAEAIVEVEDDHDVAMMFTSGTTGQPKPVLFTHEALNHTAIGNGLSYGVRRDDNYVFFLPLYHSGRRSTRQAPPTPCCGNSESPDGSSRLSRKRKGRMSCSWFRWPLSSSMPSNRGGSTSRRMTSLPGGLWR
jgi:acyl-CoA synthetase (AMP-forming)/AMP-acid ligase II